MPNLNCGCVGAPWEHNEPCLWAYRGEISFLNDSITMDTCTKCEVVVTNFGLHWEAVHNAST